ncbi:TetR/AcrR family transcriptional regulator [Streptomyces sp. NPDC059957]|uniref:TetR/AcrR family transcriptional regulator n=1 Tax=unclassified Streptomyces TaxID=2593676 RepID=UPI003652174D
MAALAAERGGTVETGQRGRGRPRTGDEVTDARLLEGALAAFAEHGYEGTSIRDIARRLGVSHTLLTARFGPKEGLWFAAMEHTLTEAEGSWRTATADPGGDDLSALRHGIVEQILFAAAHPEVLRIMTHEGAIDSPRIRFVVERFIAPLRPLVETRLGRLVAAGQLRDVPYATLHYLVTHGAGALFANPVEAALLGSPPLSDDAALRAHAEVVADLLITGLTNPQDG